MRLLTLAAALAVLATAPTASASCQAFGAPLPVTSTFDSDTECWTVDDPNTDVDVSQNNGELILFTLAPTTTTLRAPDAFLGDRSDAYGGTFSFDVPNTGARGYDVVIESSGMELRYVFPTEASGTHYVNLTESGWTIGGTPIDETTFRDALSMLNGFRFQIGDQPFGTGSEFGIDNIRLSAEPVSVSELYVALPEYRLVGQPYEVIVYAGSAGRPVADLFGASFTMQIDDSGATIQSVRALRSDCNGDGITDPALVQAEIGSGTSFQGSAEVSWSLIGSVCPNGLSGRVPLVAVTVSHSSPPPTDPKLWIASTGRQSGIDSQGRTIAFNSNLYSYSVFDGALVWPGDTDNSGQVNALDILPLGLRYGQTGPARESDDRGVQWDGSLVAFWDQPSDTHVDTNGDGSIDTADLLAVGFNFRKMRPQPASAAQLLSAPLADVSIQPHPVGTEVKILIGGDGSGLLGAAAVVGVPDGLAVVSGGPSARLDDGDVLTFWSPTEDGAEIAATRKAGADVVDGTGDLLTLTVRVESEMSGPAVLTLDDLTVGTASGSEAAGLATMSTASAVATDGGSDAQVGITALAPNPSRGATEVHYTVASAGTAQVAVYDALGRQVAVLHDGPLAAGAHRARLAPGTLAPGLYVVRLATGETVVSQTLTLLR